MLLGWSSQEGWDGGEGGHLTRMREMRDEGCIQNFGRNTWRKRTLEWLICRSKDNVGLDLRKIRWEGVDWIHLAQDRDRWRAVVNTVMNLRVPWKAGNFLTSWMAVSFWRRTLPHVFSYRPVCCPWLPLSIHTELWHTTLKCSAPAFYLEVSGPDPAQVNAGIVF
jgi:hypothetical protein